MAKKTLSRAAKNHDGARRASPPQKVVVTEAVKLAEVEPAVQEPVAPPPADAVVKPPKTRFVREQKEKKPQAKVVAVPPRSTKAAGKMMSKNVTVRPKEESNFGPRSNSKPKP